jgi:hypothetical protein
MEHIGILFSFAGDMHTTGTGGPGADAHGFTLSFILNGAYPASRVHEAFAHHLARGKVTWIVPRRHLCEVDLDAAKRALSYHLKADWIQGRAVVEPEVVERPHQVFDRVQMETHIILRILREEVVLKQQSRVFLSHKSANKKMVREFYEILLELGFQPWLDEEEMVLGANLHRELDAGMRSSCAAVFFITPEFVDEKFLEYEIDLAMREKTARASRFSIITLSFTNSSGQRGVVPQVLRTFIYGEPKCELDALRSILRALPLRVGTVEWREGR